MSQGNPGDAKLLPLRIRLPFTSEQEFVERYGSNVDRGGLFVATRSVKPEGTAISFELVLQDGTRLMRGEGVVAQVAQSEVQGQSGMLLRFTRLETRTKALVDQIVALREGGEVPDLPPAAASAPEAAPVPSAPLPPTAQVPADSVLGIDLGTTTCRAAVVVDGHPHLVPIGSPRNFALPSVIGLAPDGEVVVGQAALKLQSERPERVVVGLKRLLGRRARSRKVKDYARRFAYRVVSDPEGDVGVELEGRTFTARELTALLLGQLKVAAREFLGLELRRAVVGVPAWFNDHQRQAVIDAGADAGLEVLRLVNEPSAVALAFGFGKGLARKRLLVYDFGGGTFDAAVVEMTGDDLEVVSTGGDNFLGGLDFDEQIADALVRTLAPPARESLEASTVSWLRVRNAAEVAKIALSEADQTRVHLPFATLDPAGVPVDLTADVTRGWFEQLAAPLVDRSIEITQAVLEIARLQPQGLDEVLLVGGQSRAPLVRSRLEAMLGRAARTDVDAHGAVALGAALLGHAISLAERGKAGSTVTEVLGAPVGVAVQGGGFRRVLERNTRLPADKTLAVPVTAGQSIQLAVFQGTQPRAEDNDYLGSLQATAEKPGELTVHFSLSKDGVLKVRANPPGGRGAKASFATGEASDDTVARLLEQAPLPGDAPLGTQKGGLLGGLRRLWGRS